MLKQRVITAMILGPLVVLAVFKLPNIYLATIFGLVSLIGAWEWANLVGLNQTFKKILYVVLIAGLMYVAWFFLNPMQISMILFIASLWWAGVTFTLAFYDPGWLNTTWMKNILVYSGVIVLVPCWLGLTLLHQRGAIILMYFLILIWLADIGAYFVGKRFGKSKLAPKLSPGKSREGVLGALVMAAITACIGIYIFSIHYQAWAYFILLCVLTALISVVGDLYESLLKRRAGAKDSGTILPGHGGVMDRIDSLTAAAPGYVLGLNWILS